MINPKFALAFAVTSVVMAGAAVAQDRTVRLNSFDGSISLTGELTEFTGDTYKIATALGPFEIDAYQVDCTGAACPPPELLRSEFAIAGSNVIGSDLMPALIEAYGYSLEADFTFQMVDDLEAVFSLKGESDKPIAEVEVAARGTELSFRELLDGTATIGMASRRITDREVSTLRRAGLGDLDAETNEHIIALDGLAVLVSRDNQLPYVSAENLALVFSGQISNWSELGGLDAPINVYAMAEEFGTRNSFDELVMFPFGVELSGSARIFRNHADMSDAIAADPNGIGVLGLSYVRSARAIDLQSQCGILQRAAPFGIKTEEYPLSRRLYLYTTDKPMPRHARNLVDFVLSDAAQDVIADAGFVDQGLTSVGIDSQGLRLANMLLGDQQDVSFGEIRAMMGELINAQRLSATLRFRTGASVLDSRAQADVRRLGEYLASGNFSNKEVLLLGFTDSVGRGDLNRTLSQRRAEQVLEAIQTAVPEGSLTDVAFRTIGYGEVSPVGCNTTFEGRRINRRVEVWIRDRT